MVKNSAAARFASIAKALNGHDGVAVGSGKRGFGSDALQVNGKIFAMLRGDSLVLKLPSQRVGELVGSGVGTPFDAPSDPAPGRHRFRISCGSGGGGGGGAG